MLTPDRGPRGQAVLRRALTDYEARTLMARRTDLAPWVRPAPIDRIAPVVLTMLTGFAARDETEEETAIKAMQYATVLSDLPLWAIEAACKRFAAGSVAKDEVGERREFSRTFPPSTAHVHMVARATARATVIENSTINLIFNGAPRTEHRRTDEDIAAVRATLEKYHFVNKARPSEQDRSRALADYMAERDREAIEADVAHGYRAAGLEPPTPRADRMTPSLELMLQIGWTIATLSGQNVLVRPPDPPPRVTMSHEMGS